MAGYAYLTVPDADYLQCFFWSLSTFAYVSEIDQDCLGGTELLPLNMVRDFLSRRGTLSRYRALVGEASPELLSRNLGIYLICSKI